MVGSAAAFATALVPLGGMPVRAETREDALVPLDVSLDEVIRTTVGLRPYRAGGFVLRAESTDARTIIHSYGHGGGGMSLSWGVASLATDIALQTPKRSATVVGSGVIGLSTAIELARVGFAVSIVARDFPPDTTSDRSGAQWGPSSVFLNDAVTPEFRRTYREAAVRANRRYQQYVGDDYGVHWRTNYDCVDDLERGFLRTHETQPIVDLFPEKVTLADGQHPFPTRHARRFTTMMIDPPKYLRRLMLDAREMGIRMERRAVQSMPELALLGDLVVNATGLGAKALVNDDQLDSVRGQLSFVLPQPAVDYVTMSWAGYMFPRADGIALGGTFQHGNWDTNPDSATEARIVAGHQDFFRRMAAKQAQLRL